jgi:protein-export membrane protein SecD
LGAAFGAGWEPKLGLDLQGGFSVVLTTPEDADPAVLDQAVEIMRRRIENLGSVQEPEISVQGDRSIQVQLPGVTDRERALQAVGTTGLLSFRPVLEASLGISVAFIDGTLPQPDFPTDDEVDDGSSTTTTTTTTTIAPEDVPPNMDPVSGLTIVDDPEQDAYLWNPNTFMFYKVGPAFLTGRDIEGAEPGFTGIGGQGGGGWVVDPDFTGPGGEAFQEATAALSLQPIGSPQRQLAIVVDGEVFSAPQVAADTPAGEGLDPNSVIITIGSTEDGQAEAEDLATILRYGALPTTFERERVESVSATLGTDSLNAGLAAGIGGLLLVGIAMMIYYRALGLIAVLGLSVFGSLLLFSLITLGETQGTTLTLAGVTGIIVSIGITSDSYIVFFERIKEEHRKGRSLRPAVDQGFHRAFRTILTADTVTFSGSILLWALAIGPVKGFAITLGIATVIDVLVAYFFTRPATMLLVRSRFGEGGAFSIQGAVGKGGTEDTAEATA